MAGNSLRWAFGLDTGAVGGPIGPGVESCVADVDASWLGAPGIPWGGGVLLGVVSLLMCGDCVDWSAVLAVWLKLRFWTMLAMSCRWDVAGSFGICCCWNWCLRFKELALRELDGERMRPIMLCCCCCCCCCWLFEVKR